MKNLAFLVLFLMLCSCNFQSSGTKSKQLNQNLLTVVDSISQLLDEYHFNPTELTTDKYLELEKKIRKLAKTVQTKQEFINGFNELWEDGPFSHLKLGTIEMPAEDMAQFIDSMRVGDHSVSLEWMENTPVLTVNTMTGLDTKEKVIEALHKIIEKKPKSIIIDLRNNTGGTFAGIPLINHVLTDSVDFGVFVSRKWWKNNAEAPTIANIQNLTPWQSWSLKLFWHDVQENPLTLLRSSPLQPHFPGSVYVLISNKTASAAELVVDALAHSGNVRIIGETTAGEMLSQKMFDLPFGFQLSLPIADYYSTRTGRIEGKGIKPDVAINQSVALDLAISLITGEELEEALDKVQLLIKKMDKQPFGGEAIYLFGSMNEWGKKWNITPRFEYKSNGVYEATTNLKEGRYEFKIAPMNWAFDYGANKNQENVVIGQKKNLVRLSGSSNLTIDIEDESMLVFNLDVSNEKNATLYIVRK
jgi:hypothetical protein